jgi:hypothetical protein
LFKHLTRFGMVAGALGISGLMLASCGTPTQIINMVGSDTTQDVMGAIATQYNGSSQATSDNAQLFNSRATNAAAVTVTGDDKCAQFVYDATPVPPAPADPQAAPNGSGAGITALETNGPPQVSPANPNCSDIARASSTGGTNTSDQFWAYAKDAVTWVKFPGSHEPTNLTRAQLQGIYLCNQGGGAPGTRTPLYQFWDDPGVWAPSAVPAGTPHAAIIRYLPQTSSGTRKFFEQRILQLSGSQLLATDGTDCASPPHLIEENEATSIVTADKPTAIFPFSFAQWTAQANHAASGETDQRNGSILESIDGVAPSATSINATVNPFIGRRWVYNMVIPGRGQASIATGIVGVTSSGAGFLCKDNTTIQNTISTFGFVTTPIGPTGGSGLPNSHCRLNPAAL